MFHYALKRRRVPLFTAVIVLLMTSVQFLYAQPLTITFNDISNPNRALTGEYPTGVINWATNKWYVNAASGILTSNNISFLNLGVISATFDFAAPTTLVSIRATNIGSTASTVSINCAGNSTVTQIVAAGQSVVLTTNWTASCTTITMGASNGLSTHFDDIVYQTGAVTPTVSSTATFTVTPSPQPSTTASVTPTFTPTATPSASATSTPTGTFTATNTPVPTATHTAVPTLTSTATATLTPTHTATVTNTPVPTATITPAPSFTPTSTNTPVPTATFTPAVTATWTPVPTVTQVIAATLNSHPIVVDVNGKILSWIAGSSPYDEVVKLAWNYIQNTVPNTASGVKHYLLYCCYFEPAGGAPQWVHNPAGLYAGFVDSLLESYPYYGNASLITTVQEMLDYQLAHGTTPSTWLWANMPYASSVNGDLEYRGDGDNGRDGLNGIEPDKSAELGYGYIRFWQLTGKTVYRDAAINIANTLVAQYRTGDATHSPWPFRVNALTGQVNEEYTANIVAQVKLFDELIRLNLGSVAAYQTVRNQAWNWVLTYPMQNNLWTAYFEDIGHDASQSNKNQIVPMETARYILSHDDPATVDPQWQTHIPALLAWVKSTFGLGPFYSAWGIDEQSVCCSTGAQGSPTGLGSHTARWASINALWYERTGDLAYKEDAFRSFNYATYFADSRGVVQAAVGLGDVWYSDGYSDYIKHFMSGIGSIPEWAPANENHIVRSSSIVSAVTYGTQLVSYTTFDSASRERLRLNFVPNLVTVDGVTLPQRSDLNQAGWTYNAATGVLNLRHDTGTHIVIQYLPPTATFTPTATATETATITPTATAAPTDSASSTPTLTLTQTPSSTPSPTATNTRPPTLTPTTIVNNLMPTMYPLPPRSTPTFTPTATWTPSPTVTPSPTPTLTFTPTASNTAIPTPTSTPSPTTTG